MFPTVQNETQKAELSIAQPTAVSFYVGDVRPDEAYGISRVIVAVVGTSKDTTPPATWTHQDENMYAHQHTCNLVSTSDLPARFRENILVSAKRPYPEGIEIGYMELSSPIGKDGHWDFFDYFPLKNIENDCRGCGLGSMFEIGAIQAVLESGIEITHFSSDLYTSESRHKQLTSVGITINKSYPIEEWLGLHAHSFESRASNQPKPLYSSTAALQILDFANRQSNPEGR